MKKIILSALALTVLTVGSLSADPEKGQKIYTKKIKKICGKTGAVISALHTQDEWEAIKEGEGVKAVLKKECNGIEIKDKYESDLFDFFYEFASDSGNVPAC